MAGTVILITKRGLGTTLPGDAAFGAEMLEKFLHALEPLAERPQAICLYTEGVKIAVQDSPHVLGLRLLEGLGTEIVVCGTCLNHYGLTDRLAVGRVGTMVDIVRILAGTDRVLGA